MIQSPDLLHNFLKADQTPEEINSYLVWSSKDLSWDNLCQDKLYNPYKITDDFKYPLLF